MTVKKTRYFMDTEFMEDGHVIELLSIGIVRSNGAEYYAENLDANLDLANPWVRENVFPYLHVERYRRFAQGAWEDAWAWTKDPVVKSHSTIAAEVREFVMDGPGRPEFWAYYGSYDWVVFCQLYGKMIDLPLGWPMFCMDLKQLVVELGNPRLPKQESTAHNALNDARWNRDSWRFLTHADQRGQ